MRLKRFMVFWGFVFLFIFWVFFSGSIEQDNKRKEKDEKEEKEGMGSLQLTQCISERI